MRIWRSILSRLTPLALYDVISDDVIEFQLNSMFIFAHLQVPQEIFELYWTYKVPKTGQNGLFYPISNYYDVIMTS